MGSRRKSGRTYESPHRVRQAAATRGSIIDAARRLFVQRGYASATVDAIAEAAGVAVPTLYTTFGGKRAILWALLETMSTDVGVPQRYEQILAEPEPVRRLQLLVRIHCDFMRRHGDLLEALRTAAAVDPEAAAAWREGGNRRHHDCELVAHSLVRDSVLRADLSEAEAADVLWFVAGPETYRHLAIEQGWTPERYEPWLAQALAALLLRESRSGRSATSSNESRGRVARRGSNP
jgi:AcrR family transcriptional regulator